MLLTEAYLRVFNIPSWLAQLVLKTNNAPGNTASRCVIIEDRDNPQHCFSTDQKQYDLLVNMLKSIKLEMADITCLSLSKKEVDQMIAQEPSTPILLMTGQHKSLYNSVFICPHPYELIEHTHLKRTAWEVLKCLKDKLA